MEEDLRKRNTDCVYFLASPLTCKKGVECEYRHSEIARLNPRDCWYWLAGNCLNPICAFRHPPLDEQCEPLSQSASFQSEPVNKTNIPCYFFFNGFCSKGATCTFLHGPDVSNSARISLKTVSAVKNVSPLEKKTFVGSDTGSAPTEAHPSSFQNAPKAVMELQHQHNKNFQHSAPNNILGESASPQRSSSDFDEAAEIKSESSLPAEGFILNRSLDSLQFSDQSSEDLVGYTAPEDQVDGHSEPEERWESSPGFDVLVDDKLDDLGYEDDPEYPLSFNRDHRELNSHLLRYGYEVQYDSAYRDAGIMYEHGLCDSYHHSENEHNPDFVDKFHGHSREIMLNPMLCRKRKLLPRELSVYGWSDMDLRDCLRKRRLTDGGRPGAHISRRRHISSRQIGRIRERPSHLRTQQLRGRLASKVENNIMKSLSEIKDHPSRANNIMKSLSGIKDHPSRAKQRGWFRPSQFNGFRQHVKGRGMARGRVISSEISKEPVTRRRRSTQESSSFSGPKTLSQIKEEKTKARENGDCLEKRGLTRRNSSEAFQGPKPLSEILKDKKKLSLTVEGSSSSS